jgi:hypothetical protein
MADQETNEILRFILESLKQQAIFLDRQYRWIIALAETIEGNAELEAKLKQHPSYDLGPEPRLRSIGVMTQNIDAVIQKLKG